MLTKDKTSPAGFQTTSDHKDTDNDPESETERIESTNVFNEKASDKKKLLR